MPLRILDLDPLHLTYPPKQLRLSVISRAEFNFPSDVALHQSDLAKFLASGDVWVGNPRVCRIDFQLSLNGKPLDSKNGARVLEPLGSHICAAKLWSQLSLSSSIEIPLPDLLNSRQSEFSILLSQCHSTTTSTYPRGWILDNVDVRAPPSIFSVQIQKLKVELDFVLPKEKCLFAPTREESDFMLLDEPSSMDITHLQISEGVADELVNSTTLMLASFKQPQKAPPDHGTSSFDWTSPSSQLLGVPELTTPPFPVTQNPKTGPAISNAKHLLPKEAKIKLQEWLDMHSTNPYPTMEEKTQLINETGLHRRQVNRWLCAARHRLAQVVKNKNNEDDLLLEDVNMKQHPLNNPTLRRNYNISHINVNQIAPSSSQVEPCDQDNILSFIDDEVPSSASQPSTHTSLSSERSFMAHQPVIHCLDKDTDSTTPRLLSSSMLISAALNILIGGSACKRSIQSITLEDAFPKTSLTTLTPTIFCPKFKQLMAHNSRFLPTISHAITSTWVRNCQGPGLRAKLLGLSNLPSPGPDLGHARQFGETGSVERLNAVLQNRVWSMMQKKLSDPSMIGKIQWESVDNSGVVDTDPVIDEDLLGSNSIYRKVELDNRASDDLEQFVIDEYMDDEELLFFDPMSDDEGLLSNFDETEKMEIEKQTDEMLFGSEEYEDEDSDVLLLDGDNEETMLV